MALKQHHIITIDLNKWITQVEAARIKGCKPQYISELIKLGKVNTNEIPELGLKLVERQYFE
jgi:hypothetical protein